MPFHNFVNADNTVKSAEEIKDILKANGIDIEKPIVSTCRWGITGSFNHVALKHAGVGEVPLYDGSYSEYEAKKGIKKN